MNTYAVLGKLRGKVRHIHIKGEREAWAVGVRDEEIYVHTYTNEYICVWIKEVWTVGGRDEEISVHTYVFMCMYERDMGRHEKMLPAYTSHACMYVPGI